MSATVAAVELASEPRRLRSARVLERLVVGTDRANWFGLAFMRFVGTSASQQVVRVPPKLIAQDPQVGTPTRGKSYPSMRCRWRGRC